MERKGVHVVSVFTRHIGKGHFRPGHGAVPAARTHVLKGQRGHAAQIHESVAAAEDHDEASCAGTAHGHPAQAVHSEEEIRHHHQQIGAGHLAQPGIAAASAGPHGFDGAGEVRQPLGQIFAAQDARHHSRIAEAAEVLVGAQVGLGALASEGAGIRAYAVLKRRGQESSGPDVGAVQILGHHGAHGAVARTYVLKDRLMRLRGLGMVVDDDGIFHVGKGRAVLRLRIHHGIALELFCQGWTPLHRRDAQMTDHGQIVRPGNLVDVGYGHAAHAGPDEPLQGQGAGQGVRIRHDEYAPGVLAAVELLQFRYLG